MCMCGVNRFLGPKRCVQRQHTEPTSKTHNQPPHAAPRFSLCMQIQQCRSLSKSARLPSASRHSLLHLPASPYHAAPPHAPRTSRAACALTACGRSCRASAWGGSPRRPCPWSRAWRGCAASSASAPRASAAGRRPPPPPTLPPSRTPPRPSAAPPPPCLPPAAPPARARGSRPARSAPPGSRRPAPTSASGPPRTSGGSRWCAAR
mmetsp:Transcript_41234/g.97867  ORF Transcript_41234/g.97867 Transcript_41234/m.97867 type:complete len:206 (-) Transcript_41234:768-1385(-)